ncbi:hypothetical protein GCM10022214_81420 [Actinomadura miaoliensis]|uniref:Uncharacterized protein n=1 Tax=Actinomadura miaoliensis TaxID=430685 RepID=A0ABP7X2K3_9ACTN
MPDATGDQGRRAFLERSARAAGILRRSDFSLRVGRVARQRVRCSCTQAPADDTGPVVPQSVTVASAAIDWGMRRNGRWDTDE